MFGRKSPEILMKIREPSKITRDDEIHIVSQPAPKSYCFISLNLLVFRIHNPEHSGTVSDISVLSNTVSSTTS